MNQPHVEHEERPAAEAAAPRPGAEPGAGVRAVAGPFGLRDIVVGSAVLVMLVGSVLPFTVGSGRNLWTAFSLFYVGIGIIMPLVVAGLFTARRLAPSTRLRVGSLSLDQFASVIAVLAAIFFFLQIVYVFSVGSLLGLLGAAALLAATTFAPHIPPFAAEFSGRTEIPAHPVARDAKPLVRVPKPAPEPKATETQGAGRPGMFGQPEPADTVTGAPQSGQVQAQEHPDAGRPEAGFGAAGRTDAAAGAQSAAAPRDDSGLSAPGQPAAGQGTAAAAGTAASGAAAAAASTPETAGSSGGGNSAAHGQEVPAGEDPLPATTVNPAVQGSAPAPNTQAQESISATREENENVVEAFWFAVGTPRQIVDERTGLPLFMFYPGDWELGLEDRGHEFLVQDKRTGRIGVLRDLTNIERVSDDSSGH
ncbi:hypothetical protein GCM10009688_13810 [Arthrobacter gandavensis]|uniref:Uncharacterized protein n=1 Tax=Arthrobacter gandavensis TaxID=169960 RepID=A0ABN2P255_9MICC|nr:hypothetical protein [Arthrobacter citreus]